MWHPEAAPIAAIRNDIDAHPQRIKNVLIEDALRKDFLGGAGTESKAIRAFISGNSENALKTKPKVRTYLWDGESAMSILSCLMRAVRDVEHPQRVRLPFARGRAMKASMVQA